MPLRGVTNVWQSLEEGAEKRCSEYVTTDAGRCDEATPSHGIATESIRSVDGRHFEPKPSHQ